jgi:hypothetical protein
MIIPHSPTTAAATPALSDVICMHLPKGRDELRWAAASICLAGRPSARPRLVQNIYPLTSPPLRHPSLQTT